MFDLVPSTFEKFTTNQNPRDRISALNGEDRDPMIHPTTQWMTGVQNNGHCAKVGDHPVLKSRK